MTLRAGETPGYRAGGTITDTLRVGERRLDRPSAGARNGDMSKGQIVCEYTDYPHIDGFSIKVPPGVYTAEELLSLIWFEYQWQCDEAPKKQIVLDVELD